MRRILTTYWTARLGAIAAGLAVLSSCTTARAQITSPDVKVAETAQERYNQPFSPTSCAAFMRRLVPFTYAETAQNWQRANEGNHQNEMNFRDAGTDPGGMLEAGGLLYRLGSPSDGFPIFVDDRQHADVCQASFRNFAEVLIDLQARCRALRAKQLPGPVERGLSALATYDTYYRTYQAWSCIGREEIATVYLLNALNDSEWISNNPTTLRDELEALLPRYYRDSKKLDKLLSLLLDPLDKASKQQAGAASRWRLNRIAAADATKASDEQGAPVYVDRALLVLKVLERDLRVAGADGDEDESRCTYAHLPSAMVLWRSMWRMAHGDDASFLARQQLQRTEELGPEGLSEDAIRARLRQKREWWVARLDEEVALRRKGGAPKSVFDEELGTGCDPYAIAELTGLLIETSEVYARLVRVPLAQPQRLSDKTLESAVTRAFKEDAAIKDLADRYNAVPVPRVRTTAEGRTLELTWTFHKSAIVKLIFEEAFSGGGSGTPVPPGVLSSHGIAVHAKSFDGAEDKRTLSDVQASDFVPAIYPLRPGEQDPPDNHIWFELLENCQFDIANFVTIEVKGGELTGTASQKIWARPMPSDSWDWWPLSKLKAGDHVWHGSQAARITAASWSDSAAGPKNFARLKLAESENAIIEGFVVRCEADMVTDYEQHGIEDANRIIVHAERPLPPYAKVPRALPSQDFGVAIGSTGVNYKGRIFMPLPTFASDSTKVERLQDLLLDAYPDKTELLYRVVVRREGDASEHMISLGRSHGFMVEGKGVPVAAQDLNVGDRLVCGEGPPARVERIGIEQGRFALRHPKLLVGEWLMDTSGVLLHTDEPRTDRVGVLQGTRISLARRASSEEGRGWRIATPMEVTELLPDRSAQEKLILVHWLGAYTSQSKSSPFRVRRAVWRWDMSSHLITITADGKTLTCGPGQRIPSPDGQVRAANDLREGMRIFMLADPGEGQMPGLRECAVEKWEKRVCLDDANDRGYHELYYPEFELSPIPLVKELQGRYDNYFANGFLLGESFVEKKRDKKPGAHDGNEGGEDDGDKPGDPAKEPEPVHPQNLVRDTATDGDFAEPPKMAIELTAQDERLFRESLSALDPKLREAVEIVLSAPTARDAERIGRFREAVGMDFSKLAGLARDYLTYRQEILQAEHPQCLAETARIGVPLSYLLWEGGQGVAAHAVLEDVLLVQMRLALREDQGREFWNEPRFRMRDTVRFAIEFACWLRWVRPINAVKSNRDQQWDAVWPSGGWGDMLRYAAEKGQIFDDVRGQTAKGVQYCRLWNLVRQLDQRSGVRLPVNGFVSPGFIQGHEWEGEAAERYRMN